MATFPFTATRIALSLALTAPLMAQAVIIASGSNGNSSNAVLGPGDTLLPGTFTWIGQGGTGTLAVDGGSWLQLGTLSLGTGGSTANGSATITGAGTRVELLGDGERLTGAGTTARIGQQLFVGIPALYTQPVNGFTAGVPGGTTSATMDVLAGAQLISGRAQIGASQWSSGNTGLERSASTVTLDGAGSRWTLVGGESWHPVTGVATPFAALLSTANDRNAVANLVVRNGAELRVEGVAGLYNGVSFTGSGGRSDVLVTGAGSAITLLGDANVLQVGRSLGSAAFTLSDGAQVHGAWYTSVGRDGSFGEMLLDGAGTRYQANGTASAAANGVAQVPLIDIGRNGGNGKVTVANGARLELSTQQALGTTQLQLTVARDAASSGVLNIAGGGVVWVSAASVAPGTAQEAFNPFVRVGRDGSGALNISGGGKLLVEGGAVSTPTATRRTSVFIGSAGDTAIGGRGVASITGLGSELSVSGADAYIGVGHGPQAVGTLGVSAQGALNATILGVGNFGGTGVARFDNASVALSGQYTGTGTFGASLVIGAGSGAVGNVTATNGTQIRIANTTAVNNTGGGLSIGGSSTNSGGDGSLTLSNASVVFDMPGNNAGLSVGRSGSGLLRMSDGAVVDVGGNALFVGRLAGSDGTLIATGGSSITAGWVGIGRNRTSGGSADGGTGTMVLNGATLNAQDVVIGTNGFLGGTNGSINVSGTLTNYGIFSPGNSPGRFNVNGNYVAGAGSRLILEVQANAAGGFDTDELVFGADGTLDLAALQVEFRFLGGTDPNAFFTSGRFDIDTFVSQLDAAGAPHALSDAAYAGVQFSARADAYVFQSFSYSPQAGASFTAVPVPEPSAWLLMLGGSLALPALTRRRRVAAS